MRFHSQRASAGSQSYTPTLQSQKNRELLHHSLGDGDFSYFSHMAKEVTCAQANLTVEDAAYEIGATLSQRRPVYLSLPSDVAQTEIAIYQGTLALPQPVLSPTALQAFISAAREKLQSAHRVALLADFLADRFDIQPSYFY